MKSFILAVVCLLTVSVTAHAQSAIEPGGAAWAAGARDGATVIQLEDE